MLGGEEPSQLSQRRGMEPKIVAEAKTGTYRSAESGQGAAGSGLGLLSLLTPHLRGGGQNQAGPRASRMLCPKALQRNGRAREAEMNGNVNGWSVCVGGSFPASGNYAKVEVGSGCGKGSRKNAPLHPASCGETSQTPTAPGLGLAGV